MVSPMDPLETFPTRHGSEPQPEDFDSDLTPIERDMRKRHVAKEGGGGAGGGGGGAAKGGGGGGAAGAPPAPAAPSA